MNIKKEEQFQEQNRFREKKENNFKKNTFIERKMQKANAVSNRNQFQEKKVIVSNAHTVLILIYSNNLIFKTFHSLKINKQ